MPNREPASSSHWKLAIAVIVALMLIGLASLSMVEMPGALSGMLAGWF